MNSSITNFIPNSLPKSKSVKLLLLSILVLSAFSLVSVAPAHATFALPDPAGCTTPGLGISKAVFVNGLSANTAHAGDTLTYQVTVGLVTSTDCNISGATIYFLYPNDTKADNACGGIAVCDLSGYAGVVTVATNVAISRASVLDSITSATCSGTPAPVSGCTWDVPGSYTAATADLVDNGFDGFSCAVGISNPCELVGLTSIKDQTLTNPTGVAAAQGGIQVSVLAPHISVVKATTPKVEVGSSIAVTANVTNDGNTGLNNVTAVDDHAGPLTCGTTTLAANASTTCTGSFTAPATPGTVTNTVTVSGTDAAGQTVTNTANATTTVIKVGVSVTMACTPSSQPAPGTITWRANETNTGSASETLTDVFAGAVTGTSGPSTVAPGGSVAFTATASGLSGGSYTASVNATATDQTGANATASASATCTVIPPSENVKQFTGVGTIRGTTASGTISADGLSATISQLKVGPQVYFQVTYFVSNTQAFMGSAYDGKSHYFTLWDKWGGNIMALDCSPSAFSNPTLTVGGTAPDPMTGVTSCGTTHSFSIDPRSLQYQNYINGGGSSGPATLGSCTGTPLAPSQGTALIIIQTGNQQACTNPGQGAGTLTDGKSYDVQVIWDIGTLSPGSSATVTVVIAGGMNPGGVLYPSSAGCSVVNTGPVVRAWTSSPFVLNKGTVLWARPTTNSLSICAPTVTA